MLVCRSSEAEPQWRPPRMALQRCLLATASMEVCQSRCSEKAGKVHAVPCPRPAIPAHASQHACTDWHCMQVPELALDELDDALQAAPPGSVLYVQHGLGTGALRDGVQRLLAKRQKQGGKGGRAGVRGWQEDPGSGGAGAVVWV